MKVTLLGHAAVLVEMKGATCIMDPVFRDPFEEGTVTSCPRREVHVDKLPRIDVVVISHAHLDHFDIPSLVKLPRNADVMCPEDKTIVYALERLGFKKIHPTKAMTDMQLKGFSLLTTASHVTNVIEFGVVFKDATGTFWNQVDSVIAPATSTLARKQCGRIDLLFAMHASQNFQVFRHTHGGVPLGHARNEFAVGALRTAAHGGSRGSRVPLLRCS